MRVALTLVLVAGCATAGQARRDAEACRTGVPAACASRGLRALIGDGAPRDERDAAAWLMAACELGLAQSCADLGALYAAGRGVRKDDGRACELGLADACARAGRPPPPAARTPGIVLPPGAATEGAAASGPDDVRRALEFASFSVPVGDRALLGLTPEALERDPPAPQTEVRRFRPLFDARAPWVATCLPVYQDGENEVEGLATVSVLIGSDGRAGGVLVALDLPPRASAAPADCIREAVSRWEFPRPAAQGRVWFQLVGSGPLQALPGPPPVEGTDGVAAGIRAPREKAPGCLVREMLVPSVTGLLKTQVVVMKFAVHADGRIGQFRLLTTIQYPEIAHWLRRAVYSCEWEPGSDREGRPIALWVVLPVRF